MPPNNPLLVGAGVNSLSPLPLKTVAPSLANFREIAEGDMTNSQERKSRMVSVFPGCFGISVAPQNPCKSEHNMRFPQRFVPAWAITPLISHFLFVRGADGLLRRPSQR
jgi:hypothetical protein